LTVTTPRAERELYSLLFRFDVLCHWRKPDEPMRLAHQLLHEAKLSAEPFDRVVQSLAYSEMRLANWPRAEKPCASSKRSARVR
jgi:hypothetical protein